jgi:hypothetical protein
LQAEPARFAGLDDKLWQATLTAAPRAAADPLLVDVAVSDASGAPQANAAVDGSLLVDDFFLAAAQHATTDAGGHALLTFDAASVMSGTTHRFIHVSAGPTFPYVEQILPIP